jgi:hypothetical protein
MTIFACTKENERLPNGGTPEIFGIWKSISNEKIGEDIFLHKYKRTDKLKDEVSIIFEKDDIFKSWDYGWCGTPPHFYFFTEGKFELNGEELDITIDHYAFSGNKYKIIKLSEDELWLEVTR